MILTVFKKSLCSCSCSCSPLPFLQETTTHDKLQKSSCTAGGAVHNITACFLVVLCFHVFCFESYPFPPMPYGFMSLTCFQFDLLLLCLFKHSLSLCTTCYQTFVSCMLSWLWTYSIYFLSLVCPCWDDS